MQWALYPFKQRPERKIDAAVALMMALGLAMVADDGGTTDPDTLPRRPGLRLTGRRVGAVGAVGGRAAEARHRMALAHADEATAQVQAVGLLVKAPHTKLLIQSPWVAIMNRQAEIARKLAPELALLPARRSLAGVAPPPRDGALPGDEWPF